MNTQLIPLTDADQLPEDILDHGLVGEPGPRGFYLKALPKVLGTQKTKKQKRKIKLAKKAKKINRRKR